MTVSSQNPDPRVVAALAGTDAPRERALSLRTRRTVHNAAAARRGERAQERRSLAIALMLTGALALALAPALWAGIDDILGGETLLDLPGMLIVLGIFLCVAVAAALLLVSGERAKREPTR